MPPTGIDIDGVSVVIINIGIASAGEKAPNKINIPKRNGMKQDLSQRNITTFLVVFCDTFQEITLIIK